MSPGGALDLIKLDIEGAERELFSSMAGQEILDAATAVLIELHDRTAPGGQLRLVRSPCSGR